MATATPTPSPTDTPTPAPTVVPTGGPAPSLDPSSTEILAHMSTTLDLIAGVVIVAVLTIVFIDCVQLVRNLR